MLYKKTLFVRNKYKKTPFYEIFPMFYEIKQKLKRKLIKILIIKQ